ncbi:MAG: hypothetical protein Q9162_005928 [Coniocarpon cinnabarinum]
MPILWHTQMSVPKKLGLVITFATGSAGLIGACLRLALYVHRTYFERRDAMISTKSVALDVIVTYIECGMYLIAACLPSLRAMLAQLHSFLSTNFYSFMQKRFAYLPGDNNGQDRLAGASDKMPADGVFVKLTGIGNLDTLARQGEAIGLGTMPQVRASVSPDPWIN